MPPGCRDQPEDLPDPDAEDLIYQEELDQGRGWENITIFKSQWGLLRQTVSHPNGVPGGLR